MSFSDWFLSRNNPSLPKSEYLYGTRHLIVLGIVILCTIAFSLIFARRSPKAKRIVLYVIGGVLIAWEIGIRIFYLCTKTDFSFEGVFKMLVPMHFCSVAVWILIIGCFTNWKPLLNFACVGGLIATVAYLLYPAVGLNKTFIGFNELYSVFTHCFAFASVIIIMSMKMSYFRWKKIWQTFLIWVIIGVYGVLLNWVIFPGEDYMYLRNNPFEIDFGMPYQIILVALVLGITCIFYGVNSLKLLVQKKMRQKKPKPKSEPIPLV